MSLSQFIQNNLALVAILAAVLIAIAVYEVRNQLKSAPAVSNIKASQLINEGANLIDVRTYAEFKKGHIAGAQNFTKEQFDDFLTRHQKKKDQTYLLYCSTGTTVKSFEQKMKADGFKNTYILKQGISGWIQDNLPTV